MSPNFFYSPYDWEYLNCSDFLYLYHRCYLAKGDHIEKGFYIVEEEVHLLRYFVLENENQGNIETFCEMEKVLKC